MKGDAEKIAKKLNREARWTQSWLGRRVRSVLFLSGFAQCRHCVHCDMEDRTKYRGVRESVLPGSGHCVWQDQKPSGHLDFDDMKRIHRCPGFEQILYNFKDYGFPSDEIARIKERRWRLFIAWMGWVVAITVALVGWVLK